MVRSNFSFASGPSLYSADIMGTPQFNALLNKLVAALERVGHYLERFRQDFNYQSNATRAAYERNKHQGDIKPISLEPILSKYDQAEGNRSGKREQDDPNYRVQNSLRWATWFTFGAVVVYAFITLLIYYANNKAANAAKTAADTAKIQLELSERPWVVARVSVGGNFTFRADGSASFIGSIVLKNIGKSPAIGIDPEYRLVIPAKEKIFTEPAEQQKDLCDPLRKRKGKTGLGILNVLFPDEETPPLSFSTNVSKEVIDFGKMKFPNDPANVFYIQPVIVGCTDYLFGFAPEHHQTGFIYQLYRVDPTRPNLPLAVIVDQSLPPERLKLTEYFFDGKYAD